MVSSFVMCTSNYSGQSANSVGIWEIQHAPRPSPANAAPWNFSLPTLATVMFISVNVLETGSNTDAG